MDMQAFYRGECFDAHTYFGAHLDPAGDAGAAGAAGTAGAADAARAAGAAGTAATPDAAGAADAAGTAGAGGAGTQRGATFRTFAPRASSVTLLLERGTDDDPAALRQIPFHRVYDGNVWEVHADDVRPGDPYEFRICGADGRTVDHADPFAIGSDLRPRHRSIVRERGAYGFGDAEWMATRGTCLDRPLNIYELHAGSWRKPRDKEGAEHPDVWYRYDELAEPLIAHCRAGGFTHVEFLPLTEYPADESWGYQSTGFFSPTSRFGTIDQLKYLIDRLHQAGIGAILDFVPVHFAADPWGLARYDGTALFEYPNQDVGLSEWGSMNFMHSRGEVRSFLQSSADWWLSEFHFDGLRLDAISRIIYWQGDERRGVNGGAVSFIQTMNEGLKRRHPGCILAAEDSTDYFGVTRGVELGGLGFDYKWDLGWMHDTLEFFQTPPAERPAHYHKLTFSMMYYANERYLLPLSHDEVVHGKATVLQKMHGGYEGKFGQARALYMYMTAHPGKMLNFMGSEFGQLREWDESREQDWLLLSYPVHDAFWRYMRELGQLYLDHPALWCGDYEADGFTWIDCRQEGRVLYAFMRRGQGERIACLLNLGGAAQDWSVEIPGVEVSCAAGVGAGSDGCGTGAVACGDGTGAAGAGQVEGPAAGECCQGAQGPVAGCDAGTVGSNVAAAGSDAADASQDAARGSAPNPEPASVLAETLLYSDWQQFGGDTPASCNPCRWEAGRLRCELAACSGVLVRLP